MRSGEIGAVEKALEFLTGALTTVTPPTTTVHTLTVPPATATSLLQISNFRSKAGLRVRRHQHSNEVSHSDLRGRAIELLASKGIQHHSSLLSAVATQLRSGADPFVKVKGIIQKLLERLLDEAKEENTLRGWCDTETGKFTTERGFRKDEILKLGQELDENVVAQTQTADALAALEASLSDEKDSLNRTSALRAQEKDANLQSIRVYEESIDAIREAKLMLHEFYRDARNQAPVASFLQQHASPVDEVSPGAGFSGEYRGEQDQYKAVAGLLDVITSDFQRDLSSTREAEKTANQEFQDLRAETEALIAKAETSIQQRRHDQVRLEATHAEKTTELTTAQGLLDDALRGLENIKSLCVDTSMSKEERAAKRDAEIEALKQAHAVLGGEAAISQ